MSMNNIVCWLDIPVNNLDRAITFYSAVLGQNVTKEKSEQWEFGLLPHKDNNVSGCLCKLDDNQPSQVGPLVYLSVEGRLDAALEAASSSGGKVLQPKHEIGPHGYRALIADSEGNRIALHSHVA